MKTLCYLASLIPLLMLTSSAFAQGSTVPRTITSPLGKKMTLKFNDEFDAVRDKDGKPYIDRAKWETTFWQGSGERTLKGNQEAQNYLDKDYGGPKGRIKPEQRINPFSFEKPGVLTISATRVPDALAADYGVLRERPFASGLLTTDKTFTFKYGYAEGRFKLPPNRGSWPAFWMLANDPSLGDPVKAHAWPPEIDIFEFMGHWKKKFSGAVLVPKSERDKTPWRLRYKEAGVDLTAGFHTWAVEWNENEIALIFDGQIWTRDKTPDSLHRSMYLLVNLAVGGKWFSSEMTNAKTPAQAWEVDDASMPWKMECDYIRVYQEVK
ncbi:MAG: 1,3,4-beta-glycanase [Rariglobus sp.]|nr:1,3,4-beta-glycanase [Rariglobus sp.]